MQLTILKRITLPAEAAAEKVLAKATEMYGFRPKPCPAGGAADWL